MIDKPGRSQKESEQPGTLIHFLDAIEKTGYDIMATGSLSARKDHADINSRITFFFTIGLKCQDWHSVGIREKGGNLFLIGNRLRRCSLFDMYRSFQRLGQFGLICGTSHLQCTLFHRYSFLMS